MTTAILLVSVAVLLVLAVAGWAVAWWQSGVIARLTAARHVSSRPCGDPSPARPGTSLVSDREAAAHADAMHAVSEPFLPSGSHAQTWPRLTERTVPVKPTEDRAPWETRTAAQPVLSQELQDMRAEYIASRMREAEANGALTCEAMRKAMTGAPGRVPAPEPTNEQAPETEFGTAPQLEIAPELAERGAA